MWLSSLVTRVLLNGKTVVLVEPLELLLPSKSKVVVPIGFETDMASVPRYLHAFIPKGGKWNHSAVCHDWLYHHKKMLEPAQDLGSYQPKEVAITRKEADKVFLYAMEISKVRYTRRMTMYWGVRAFGQRHWDCC